MEYTLGILILFFAIGDLIGQNNIQRFESNWIAKGRRIIQQWKNVFVDSVSWWKSLLKISLILLAVSWLSSSSFACILASTNDSFTVLTRLISGVYSALSWSIGIMLCIKSAMWMNRVIRISENYSVPLEFRILKRAATMPQRSIEWTFKEAKGTPPGEALYGAFLFGSVLGGLLMWERGSNSQPFSGVFSIPISGRITA